MLGVEGVCKAVLLKYFWPGAQKICVKASRAIICGAPILRAREAHEPRVRSARAIPISGSGGAS